MVPAHSHKVSRVSWYSGSCLASSGFIYGAFTLSGRSFQDLSITLLRSIIQSEPHHASTMVWALPRSLAATGGITFVFSSSGYLDVSVHRVTFSDAIYSHQDTHALPWVSFLIRISAD